MHERIVTLVEEEVKVAVVGGGGAGGRGGAHENERLFASGTKSIATARVNEPTWSR